MNFKVNFAGLPIEINARYDRVYNVCKEYLTDEEPLFSVEVSEETVKKETESAEFSPDYIESIQIYRSVSEKLPYYNRVLLHGAAVEYDGKAYIFIAPSGTGKSTHISLWRYFKGDKVKIINGDKPILKIDDEILVYGTPYSGKEGWNRNVSVPLGGICLLSQGKTNVIRKLEPKDSFIKLYLETFKPREKTAAVKTVEMVKKLCFVDCYELSCDISEEAVNKSFNALIQGVYDEN